MQLRHFQSDIDILCFVQSHAEAPSHICCGPGRVLSIHQQSCCTGKLASWARAQGCGDSCSELQTQLKIVS